MSVIAALRRRVVTSAPPAVAPAPQYCRVRVVTFHDGRQVKAHECSGDDPDAVSIVGAKHITDTGHWIRGEA